MFEHSTTPRLFGVPPGADFPSVLVERVLAAHEGRSPDELARVQILVNTRRMERRLKSLFQAGAARLLPRIGLVTDIDRLLPGADLPPPVSRLRRKLELSQLTTQLIEAEPDLAARSAAVDLADSLASLLDEMQGEGMDPARLSGLDVGDVSLHWERSLKFLDIARHYVDQIQDVGMDDEARRRLGVQRLIAFWQDQPPSTPVIVAGSTGSRATTRMLMCAVAKLPQGALLLPGFDFDVPDDLWDSLSQNRDAEDHPQFRFAALLEALNAAPSSVVPWGEPPDRQRNELISLSLRPARLTDQWLTEGAALSDLRAATQGLSLVEAPNPKDEAHAIAIALREAVEVGKKVALITPDRTLTRRVSAILTRWKIVPDDSAGVPLSLTPPGRLLRQVARAIGKPATTETIVGLLKHPLTRNVDSQRGPHLRITRRFELFLRSQGVFVITESVLQRFGRDADANVTDWVAWLRDILDALNTLPAPMLQSALSHHVSIAEALADENPDGSGMLWEGSAGEACLAQIDTFRREQEFTGALPFLDYLRLFEMALNAESDRVPTLARPDVMIWGTLEARVQGADLVVLAGLNEGTWPEPGTPDPWLNRSMRRDLGLLLPEGQVGLAAHDYQQAAAAPQVILCRSKRSADGESVPSRWLNRLTNLLSGLADKNGPEALLQMKDRGDRLLRYAAQLDQPAITFQPEKRPAPAPPSRMRPTSLSVTEVAKLIRDPYAIYARHTLRLEPIQPLMPGPDARLKGIVFHDIVRSFFRYDVSLEDKEHARARLMDVAAGVLHTQVPWPAIRNHWAAHLAHIADHLIETELARRKDGICLAAEVKGKARIGDVFEVRGRADRIDRLTIGSLVVFDYKTGTPPTPEQVKNFDKQLLIEAVMAEAGGFEGLDPLPVDRVAYLHLGRTPKDRVIALEDDNETVTVSGDLLKLFTRYHSEGTGYISRRAMEKMRYEGDYDHLARFGEWDASAKTDPEPME